MKGGKREILSEGVRAKPLTNREKRKGKLSKVGEEKEEVERETEREREAKIKKNY